MKKKLSLFNYSYRVVTCDYKHHVTYVCNIRHDTMQSESDFKVTLYRCFADSRYIRPKPFRTCYTSHEGTTVNDNYLPTTRVPTHKYILRSLFNLFFTFASLSNPISDCMGETIKYNLSAVISSNMSTEQNTYLIKKKKNVLAISRLRVVKS